MWDFLTYTTCSVTIYIKLVNELILIIVCNEMLTSSLPNSQRCFRQIIIFVLIIQILNNFNMPHKFYELLNYPKIKKNDKVLYDMDVVTNL